MNCAWCERSEVICDGDPCPIRKLPADVLRVKLKRAEAALAEAQRERDKAYHFHHKSECQTCHRYTTHRSDSGEIRDGDGCDFCRAEAAASALRQRNEEVRRVVEDSWRDILNQRGVSQSWLRDEILRRLFPESGVTR